MVKRVAVFIDYQNVYHCARQAFGDPDNDPPTFGHVLPQRLGLLLKQLGEDVDPDRELCSVTVYRGSSRALRVKPLTATGWRIWNHWLDRQRFEYVRDDTDYLARSSVDAAEV